MNGVNIVELRSEKHHQSQYNVNDLNHRSDRIVLVVSVTSDISRAY